MSTLKVSSTLDIPTPTVAAHAVNKGYADTALALKMDKTGGLFTGPANIQHAVLSAVAGHVTIDLSLSNVFTLNVTEALVIDNPVAATGVAGAVYTIIIKNSRPVTTTSTTSTTSSTTTSTTTTTAVISFGNAYLFPNGTLPSLASTVGATDILTIRCNPFDAGKFLCSAQLNFM